jgi:predicted O-linked N-acetylglucosamine transferase (SPINDLY family)
MHGPNRANLLQLASERHRAGRLAEAESILRQLLAQDPTDGDALHHLAGLLARGGRTAEAAELFRQAVGANPDVPAAHLAYARVLFEQSKFDQMIEACERARQLDPGNPAGLVGIGLALRSKGNLRGAIDTFARAVALHPKSLDACNNLTTSLLETGRIDDAVTCLRDGLARGLSSPQLCGKLGNVLCDQGELEQAIETFDRGLEIHPDARVASSRLYTLHHHPDYPAQRLREEHVRWDRSFAAALRREWQPHHKDPNPNRKLRIGYVASNLGNHPVGRLLVPIFANRDREKYEVYCYCDVRQPDAVGEALSRNTEMWRITRGMSDQTLAAIVRADRIDILVDLNMHTLGNRMLLFARKPAPVQVSYLAYPGTSGLAAMDYRITDAYLDEEGSRDGLYVEQSLRLAHCFWCYPAPPEAPPVGPLPALASGHVQFGSMNSFAKVTPEVLALWCELLGRVPGSTLLLYCPSEVARLRVNERFERAGIAPSSVRFVGRVPLAEYYARFGDIDIALDPFPYAGGTTTCDTLWMGVPAVTLVGETGVSRAGLSILSNVGLAELIARTPEQYVQIATDLAGDLPRLDKLRQSLRDRMRSSKLMDARCLVSSLECAYDKMWTGYLDERSPKRKCN